MTDMVVSYEGALRCRARHEESGTILVTDAPRDHHGQGESFSPSDLLSVSLGSCILSIMAIAARSIDTDIPGATATVAKEMETIPNMPRRISRIAVEVRIPGTFDRRQRA
jgi:putative redox protein